MMDADWEPRQGESLAAAGGVDMVTVTMGGNDAGFAKVLEACMTGKCDQSTLDGQESLADIGARIEAVLSQIKLDAPGRVGVRVGVSVSDPAVRAHRL